MQQTEQSSPPEAQELHDVEGQQRPDIHLDEGHKRKENFRSELASESEDEPHKKKHWTISQSLEIFFLRYSSILKPLIAISLGIFALIFLLFCVWHLITIALSIPSLLSGSASSSRPHRHHHSADSTQLFPVNSSSNAAEFDLLSPELLALSAANFPAFLKLENEFVLVEFAAEENCPRCPPLASALGKVHHKMQKKGVPLPMGRLSCTESPQVCQGEGVVATPSVRVYRQGRPHGADFSPRGGGVSPEELLHFMKSKERLGQLLGEYAL